MTGHTYLLKSRHGVYYFRAVVPARDRDRPGSPRREIRISLRTKDRALAKRLVAEKAYRMTEHRDWDAQADREEEMYWLGKRIFEEYKHVDLDHTYNWNAFCEAVSEEEMRAYLFYCEYEDFYRQRKQSTLAPTTPPSLSTSQPTTDTVSTTKADALVVQAIERFVEAKKHGGRGVRLSTADKYGAQCRLFLRIISNDRPDLRLSMIKHEDLHTYVDTLPRLQKKTSTRDTGSLNLVEPGSEPAMSKQTIFSHAVAVNQFLIWCQEQHYYIPQNLHSILAPLLKKPKKPEKPRVAFSEEQLRLLFDTDQYRSGAFKRPSDYWVPLIALFTGAREGELCQLHAEDIYQDTGTGIWVIDINDRNGKRLKSDETPRLIPVHEQLIKLGFIDYWREVTVRQQLRMPLRLVQAQLSCS